MQKVIWFLLIFYCEVFLAALVEAQNIPENLIKVLGSEDYKLIKITSPTRLCLERDHSTLMSKELPLGTYLIKSND